jgi:hypothetical protein
MSLDDFSELLSLPFEFYSLQKEVPHEDLEILNNSKIIDHQKSLRDFSDTASLIKMLDVVISVDSVIAHLAGALGKKTFLLLPEKSSFLWMNERKDSPWYPSVRIFRQSTLGDWKKANARTYLRASIMTASIKNYFPYLLPLLLVFSRSLADITIVLISLLFLYYSYKKIGWHWVKEKWFCFALIFTIYCLTINSAMSIEPTETLAYSLFFIRWPIFAMALSYWILNDIQSLKKFFVSLTVVLFFIIFDTWWQFIFDQDIFGFEKYSADRLTGPFKNNPHVGAWIAKLVLLPPMFLILYKKLKLQHYKNHLTYTFFIVSSILFLSVFITGERMALLLILANIFIMFIGIILDKLFSLKKW